MPLPPLRHRERERELPVCVRMKRRKKMDRVGALRPAWRLCVFARWVKIRRRIRRPVDGPMGLGPNKKC